MINWKDFLDFKSKKFLNGVLSGALSMFLVCVLSGFVLSQVVQPEEPPVPLVTAEQVVEQGYGVINVDEETQAKSFVFYTHKEVYEQYKDAKKKERVEKFKGFFRKIGDFFKRPFKKKKVE